MSRKAYWSFVKAAVQSPLGVGTIFPSSPQLSQAMIEFSPVDSAKLIVELGPGSGAITQPLFNHMKPEQSYLGIEMSDEMVAILRQRFPRLKFHEGPAEDIVKEVGGENKVDLVVSSLPWTLFSYEIQERTLKALHASLKPGGSFTTYVCVNALWYPGAKSFLSLLHSTFASVEENPIVWLNVPPAKIFRARK